MNKALQFLVYNMPQEDIKVNVVMRYETIWLTQKAMAELFGVQIPAINKHLKNIFEEGELNKETTISKMEIVQNAFLTFRQYDVLTSKGKISKQQADRKANEEYDAFNITQKIESDFDKVIKFLALRRRV